MQITSDCGTINDIVVGPNVVSWTVPKDCTVTLEQMPDSDHRFDGWSGTGIFDCNGSMESDCFFIMSGDATAEAKFVEEHTLTLNVVGLGSLTATSIMYPSSIWKADTLFGPETITVPLDYTPPMHIVADAYPGNRFDHWEQDGFDSSQKELNFILTEDTTVTAVFIHTFQFRLTVEDGGTVSVYSSCGTIGTIDFPLVVTGPAQRVWGVPVGCEVNLTQTADSDCRFDGWAGTGAFDCNDYMGEECSFVMTGPATAETKFMQQHTLNLAVYGYGSCWLWAYLVDDINTVWWVTSLDGPEGITKTFDHGTKVGVFGTSNSSDNCHFDYWLEGVPDINQDVYEFELTEDTTISAVFYCEAYPEVFVHEDGWGTVDIVGNCNSSDLAPGEPCEDMLLYPCPTEGFRFVEWKDYRLHNLGDVTPYNLYPSGDQIINAYFEAQPELNIEKYGNGLVDHLTTQLLCGDEGFDPTSSPGAFQTHDLLAYTYVSTDKTLYDPDSEAYADLLDTLGWRFDHWQIYDKKDKEDKKDKDDELKHYSQLNADISYQIAPEENTTVAAIFVDHHLPTDLQFYIDFLRNEEKNYKFDTLDLYLNDFVAYKSLMESANWDTQYYSEINAALSTLRANNPLVIDDIGQFNLSSEKNDFPVPEGSGTTNLLKTGS